MFSTKSYSTYLSQSLKIEMNRTKHNWISIVPLSITNASNLLNHICPFLGDIVVYISHRLIMKALTSSELLPITVLSYHSHSNLVPGERNTALLK